MLKKRLIPVLYIKNGLIVRSENFEYHQNIGNIINEAKRYNEWDIDELIYIDISREKFYDLRRDDHKIKSYFSIEEIILEISKVCFMPLTFGGGIKTIEDMIKNSSEWVELVENSPEATRAKLNPRYVSGTLKTVVGRVRKMNLGPEYLNVFTSGDQLLWGAAEPLRRMLNILL